jgi:stage V sporulation protein AC
MNLGKKQYPRYASAHAPKSPLIPDCLRAFFIGGSICAVGQLFSALYRKIPALDQDGASLLTSVTLIFLAVLFTALGLFDKLAKFAGAGTLVPITGFANAVASPAIDSRAEGMILGVGSKIFTVAGPVILYGTLAGVVYGVFYWLTSVL